MKGKFQQQIQPNELEFVSAEQVQAEINSFRQAVDSYPARVAKEPGLTFHQHLGSFFITDRTTTLTARAGGRFQPKRSSSG